MHVQVAIIGLNRLSVSFALALKRHAAQPKAEHTFTITGSDPQNHAMKAAEQMGAADETNRSLGRAVNGTNIIIVNAPVSELESVYKNLGSAIKPGMVVLDLTPHKLTVIELAQQYFPANAGGAPEAYLVGLTPIVNAKGLYTGDQDVEAAQVDLFEDAEVLVTPDTHCPPEAIALAEDIVQLVGGRPRFMDPAEHDGLSAATEVLPSLLGMSVFYMLQQSDGWPELRRMVNPALGALIQHMRHQTAADLLTMFTQNQANLARHLTAYIETLEQVRAALLDEEGPEQVEALLTRVYREWEAWDVKRHSGRWEESQTPDLGGRNLMGDLFGGALGRVKPGSDKDDH